MHRAYMDSKTLILTILIVSTICVVLVTMTSFEQIANAATTSSTTTKSSTTTSPNGNNINCQSKTGTANTQTNLGTLKLGGAKCTGENGGTATVGGIKSNSGIGMHGIKGPNGNSHFGGFIKR